MLEQTSTSPPTYRIELLFSFKGVKRLEVPKAKSKRSTSAVLSPRMAASRATPEPTIPPPMTSTSSGSRCIRS